MAPAGVAAQNNFAESVPVWAFGKREAKKPTVASSALLFDDVTKTDITGLLSPPPAILHAEQTVLTPPELPQQESTKNVAEAEPEITYVEAYVEQNSVVQPCNDVAGSIIRSTLISRLLSNLRHIQQCETSSKVAYARELLHDMRTMRDLVPFDPIIKVVMALYDAMAVDNMWATYTKEQYAQAFKALREAAKHPSIGRKHLAKAILTLENAGFDTLPFSTIFEDTE